ncbi:MAG: transcription antitermination factor NusB [Bacilli bacterium]|nr:transcription antitermination factor NusB [Bacilli bacterium]
MINNRSELREIAMTALYQIFLYESSKIEYDVFNVVKELIEVENEFVNDIVNGVLNNQKDIDDIANKYLNDWDISRLGKTDQAVLRMGIYELLYTDTPEVVCINEAVELAKKYSDEAVRKMINGVLDKVYHNK